MAKATRLGKKVKLITQCAIDTKAKDVVVLDISKASGICDYFVICSGTSSRQNKAIADNILGGLKKNKTPAEKVD